MENKFDFVLDPKTLEKEAFIQTTNNKPVEVEKVSKLFYNDKFQRHQFVLNLSCEEDNSCTKLYISPSVKDEEAQELYFSPKSTIYGLISYALTGEILDRGITVSHQTLKEALESCSFSIQWDLTGKYPKIVNVE